MFYGHSTVIAIRPALKQCRGNSLISGTGPRIVTIVTVAMREPSTTSTVPVRADPSAPSEKRLGILLRAGGLLRQLPSMRTSLARNDDAGGAELRCANCNRRSDSIFELKRTAIDGDCGYKRRGADAAVCPTLSFDRRTVVRIGPRRDVLTTNYENSSITGLPLSTSFNGRCNGVMTSLFGSMPKA